MMSPPLQAMFGLDATHPMEIAGKTCPGHMPRTRTYVKFGTKNRDRSVQIRSTLTFPVIWAPVANLAPTIFLRLRQYVHHMYLGGLT
eukprot:SAG11_NODE_28342_length_322_cov_4.143498_1_plen_86_part_10